MKKATPQQIDKMKSLLIRIDGSPTYEQRGTFSHFLQILNDIDSLSQFQRDFSLKLIRFDFDSDKTYITNELREIMKSAIDYYSENS